MKQLSNNKQGFLMIVLLVSVAIIGIVFAVYYGQRIRTNKQIIDNMESQKESLEQKVQNSLEEMQKQIEAPQEAISY